MCVGQDCGTLRIIKWDLREAILNAPNNSIYLDYNATTPLDERVLEVMLPFLTDHFASPASSHGMGLHAREAVEKARSQVASLIGAAHPSEIFFTSGGTESNNSAIFGVAHGNTSSRRELVSSVIEHAATRKVIEVLGDRDFDVSWLGVDELCQIDLEQARETVDSNTLLVSVMHANNEVGAIQPIPQLGALCREQGALFHVDGAQAVGKISVNVQRDKIDLYSLVGHKFYGPKGIGALYVRDGVDWQAQMLGAGHERGRRAGTPNVPAIVGLGHACQLAKDEFASNTSRLRIMRDALRTRLLLEIPSLHVTCPPHVCLPHTLHICFPEVLGADVLAHATRVLASTGSACHKPGDPPSATLVAMQVSEELARGSVRLSLGHGVTSEDLEAAASALIKAYKPLLKQRA